MTSEQATIKAPRKLRNALILLAGIGVGIGGTLAVVRAAARGHSAHEQQSELYQCPMHPQYTADHPGDCPVCGMKLVRVEASDAGPRAGKGRLLFYRSPMNPAQTSPVQRKDEMGMDFVPVYESDVSGATEVVGLAGVQIDAQRQQLIGLRTAPVERVRMGDDWRTVGRVAIDERRVHKVNVKVDGFVDKLFVDFIGKPVRRGQPLLSIYSPELLSVQNEYLLALKTRASLAASTSFASSGEELVASARRRLELWDIPASEIALLEKTGKARRTLTLTSPYGGIVTAKSVVQGSRLAAGDTPFELTDLSEVWVLADAHETDLPRVRVGTPALLTLAALPNRTFKGRVSFIDPVLDARTRTAKVRLSFANPRAELKPEMFGQVVFQSLPRWALTVPPDAVIDSGERKVVFVSLGEGRFVPREIETGHASADRAEVLDGLHEGERVVVRANFLVDSESRLKAALAALAAKPPATDAGHAGHGGPP